MHSRDLHKTRAAIGLLRLRIEVHDKAPGVAIWLIWLGATAN